MTLRDDLDLIEVESDDFNPFEKHYLMDNPFPGYGETRLDVCFNQKNLKQKFVSVLRNFPQGSKRLLITGKNGAGKTNILRYFELLTDEARRERRIKNLHPVYVQDPGDSFFSLHEQIINKLEASLLGDLFAKLKLEQSPLSFHQQTDELMRVVKAVVDPGAVPYGPQEERKIDAFIRWLRGEKLPPSYKKLLTIDGLPPADITSTSLAIRYLDGLLELLNKHDLCDGIVLLFDEFEEIFEDLPRSRQSRYAQDLRHLFDTLIEPVFFVIATTPNPEDLRQYPAIERRLGEPMALEPIDTIELAIDFVLAYLTSERDNYEMTMKERGAQLTEDRPVYLEPLTEEKVKEVYLNLKEKADTFEFDVLPGFFLPQIREEIRLIVESRSS